MSTIFNLTGTVAEDDEAVVTDGLPTIITDGMESPDPADQRAAFPATATVVTHQCSPRVVPAGTEILSSVQGDAGYLSGDNT